MTLELSAADFTLPATHSHPKNSPLSFGAPDQLKAGQDTGTIAKRVIAAAHRQVSLRKTPTR